MFGPSVELIILACFSYNWWEMFSLHDLDFCAMYVITCCCKVQQVKTFIFLSSIDEVLHNNAILGRKASQNILKSG